MLENKEGDARDSKGFLRGILCGIISGLGFLMLPFGENLFRISYERHVAIGLFLLFFGMVLMLCQDEAEISKQKNINQSGFDDMDFGSVVPAYAYTFF
ncbi:MAG: hypothetical protein PHT88_00780 [Candidatus Moranbacteria bacterium]|nr:hypothetical protein [Candidatus Moranbacteria bacterium]